MREIEDILDIEPQDPKDLVKHAKNSLKVVSENYDLVFGGNDERFNSDFEEIRDTLKGLIYETNEHINKMGLIAADSEKASMYTALTQMMTVCLNTNKQLMELYTHKQKYHQDAVKVKNASDTGSSNYTQNNVIFNGTTSDLMKWVEETMTKK